MPCRPNTSSCGSSASCSVQYHPMVGWLRLQDMLMRPIRGKPGRTNPRSQADIDPCVCRHAHAPRTSSIHMSKDSCPSTPGIVALETVTWTNALHTRYSSTLASSHSLNRSRSSSLSAPFQAAHKSGSAKLTTDKGTFDVDDSPACPELVLTQNPWAPNPAHSAYAGNCIRAPYVCTTYLPYAKHEVTQAMPGS